MNDAGRRAVLARDRQSLTGPLGCSVSLHLGAAVAAVAARGVFAVLVALFPWCAPQPLPLIHDALEVSVVSLPKSATKMPDRAARAPDPLVGKEPDKVEEPPPVKESDLVHKTDTPEPKPGTPDERTSRQELLERVERQRLLDQLLDAPEGPRDRLPTDPEGTGDEVLAALSAQAMGDPAYARWRLQVENLVRSNFNPVGSRPGLLAVGQLVVDGTGRVRGYSLAARSGVLSYDSAAERAMGAISQIPLPPEKWLPLLQNPVTINFTPPL